MRVQDVMTDQVYKVSPDATAEDAWNVMRLRRIHHLVVTHAGRIVGLLSSHDVGELGGRRKRERHTVADVMTAGVVTVPLTTPVRKATEVMQARSVDCLVVVSRHHIVGIVTAADLLDLLGRGLEDSVTPLRRTIHRRVAHDKRHRAPSAC